jgi:hypothetical protein
MILSRQVFQVKYGHMDEVLAAVKAMPTGGMPFSNTRVLTDISGPNFTLVIETKAESVDAYMKALQAMFEAPGQGGGEDVFMNLIASGSREFYTIEFESGS